MIIGTFFGSLSSGLQPVLSFYLLRPKFIVEGFMTFALEAPSILQAL